MKKQFIVNQDKQSNYRFNRKSKLQKQAKGLNQKNKTSRFTNTTAETQSMYSVFLLAI